MAIPNPRFGVEAPPSSRGDSLAFVMSLAPFDPLQWIRHVGDRPNVYLLHTCYLVRDGVWFESFWSVHGEERELLENAAGRHGENQGK